MKSTIVTAALIAAMLGTGAVLPAIAQDAPTPPTPPAVTPATPAPPAATTPDQTPRPMHRFARNGGGQGGWNRGPGMNRMNGGGRLLALACSDKGAAVLQRLLDRSATRLDLTADQQKLFDTFREKALTSATSFATACQAARPDRTQGQRPDMIDRLQTSLAVDQARITALNAVLPDFKALYDSLSADQRSHLRFFGMGNRGNGNGMRGGANGDHPHHWGNRNDRGGRDGMNSPSAT